MCGEECTVILRRCSSGLDDITYAVLRHLPEGTLGFYLMSTGEHGLWTQFSASNVISLIANIGETTVPNQEISNTYTYLASCVYDDNE